MIMKANSLHMPIADKSVQAIITSPPYWGLRKYDVLDITFPDGWTGQLGHEPGPKEYIEHLMLVMAECWRVLRDDGICFVNLGDTFIGGSMSGNAQNKAGRYAKNYQYPKVSSKQPKIKTKSLSLVPERFALACLDMEWIIRNKIVWHKLNAMPASVKDRLSVRWEQIYMLTKSGKYCFDLDAIREKTKFPYQPFNVRIRDAEKKNKEDPKYKASEKEIREHKRKWVDVPGQKPHSKLQGHHGYFDASGKCLLNPKGKNPGDVWEINIQAYPGAHFSTFPEKLVERMLLCSTKVGDYVLDPFCGSGTVGRVAIKWRRKPVLLDLGYQDQQVERMKGVQTRLY